MDTTYVLAEVCEDRDFADWHQGLEWCAVWVVMAHSDAVQGTVQAARVALGDALLPRYERQPHLTVAYRGLCAGTQDGVSHHAPLHTAAEFGAAQLQADVARLARVEQLPFALALQGVGSFTTVPYLAVSQGMQELAALHAALVPQAYSPGWRYVPHITIGHYAQQVPLLQAVQTLQSHGIGQLQMPLQVQQLALVRYATRDIAGPLEVEGVWDLAQQRYVPAPGALWQLEDTAPQSPGAM